MNNINQTLYIPLYGKAYVSSKGIILNDPYAQTIWQQQQFPLKGKAKSKWLAYYMAMRSATFDQWVKNTIDSNPNAIVISIGCGLDSRYFRLSCNTTHWYDIDFEEVISERKKYFHESNTYHMISADMTSELWKDMIPSNQDAIVILEGVSMYFKPDELTSLLISLHHHFNSIHLLMDCYSTNAAKASKYKNPINEVGVNLVYGFDDPYRLATQSGYIYVKQHDMTPVKYINQLSLLERFIFKKIFAGNFARSLYQLYEFTKNSTAL